MMLTVIIMSALAFCSCGGKKHSASAKLIFDRIDASGLDPAQTIWFEPLEQDSTLAEGDRCDLQLILRFSQRHEQLPLPVTIQLETPSGTIANDTLLVGGTSDKYEIEKTQNFGITEFTINLAKEIVLQPGLAIGVNTPVPKEKTRGLLNVGLRVSPN